MIYTTQVDITQWSHQHLQSHCCLIEADPYIIPACSVNSVFIGQDQLRSCMYLHYMCCYREHKSPRQTLKHAAFPIVHVVYWCFWTRVIKSGFPGGWKSYGLVLCVFSDTGQASPLLFCSRTSAYQRRVMEGLSNKIVLLLRYKCRGLETLALSLST